MGGAIFVAGGNASIVNSSFEDNFAIGGDGQTGGDGLGGALYLAVGNLALTNNTIQENTVDGGMALRIRNIRPSNDLHSAKH